MNWLKPNSTVFRLINVTLINALIAQILTPVAFASQYSNSIPNLNFSIMNVSNEHRANTIKVLDGKTDMLEIVSKKATSNTLSASTSLSGPGQSESSSFSLNSTDGMVDKFTGDFNYSIPLADLEGFPINISYNSNVTMNSEASWVGLGWDLNLGSVSRQMRGVPDEFNAEDIITQRSSILEDRTEGKKNGGYVGLGMYGAFIGFNFLIGKYQSTYRGLGETRDYGLQLAYTYSAGGSNDDAGNPNRNSSTLSIGIGYSSDSKGGITTNRNIGFSYGKTDGVGVSASLSQNKSTRYGIVNGNFGINLGLQSKFDNDFTLFNRNFTYGTKTAIPKIPMSVLVSNSTFDMDLSAGIGPLVGGYKHISYKNNSFSPQNGLNVNVYALGFFHNGKRTVKAVSPIIRDFKRTTDNEYSAEMKDIPASFQTYDLFSYSSPAGGGAFRGYRTDFGTYEDPYTTIKTNPVSENVSEFLDRLPTIIANMFETMLSPDIFSLKVGYKVLTTLKISAAFGKQKSTVLSNAAWQKAEYSGGLTFTANENNNQFDKTVYFRKLGELTPANMEPLEYIHGNEASSFDVHVTSNQDTKVELKNEIGADVVSGTELNNLNSKPIVAEYINPKIAENVTTGIKSFTPMTYTSNPIPRINTIKKANHISEVEIVSTDGVRSVFGIPAYSNKQYEVSFSVDGNSPNGGVLINYLTGENSIANVAGRSHAFEKSCMPGYATAFLLTEMYSPDYVDRLGDGPTLDDVGNYYKLNYSLVEDNFQWRSPMPMVSMNPQVAFIHQGLKGTNLDNMAMYSYGDKELWYTHSVESKNLIAVFVLGDRKDGCQFDENGNKLDVGYAKLQRLLEIRIYNKDEFKMNPSLAKPVKTVMFEYDYSLCRNYPGNKETSINYNESGKLTLKGIRVISGSSKSDGLQNYQFNYGNSTVNPDFDYNTTDAWDSYQPNDATLPNADFPSTNNKNSFINNSLESDKKARAWKLDAIVLPTGGAYAIAYENDTYSYVQDKKAMRFFQLHGMMKKNELFAIKSSGNWNGIQNLSNTFSESDIHQPYYNRVVLVFKLDQPAPNNLTQQQADIWIKDRYFKNENNSYLTELYIKDYAKIKTGVWENVPSFVEISPTTNDAIGAMPKVNNAYDYGYVVLKEIYVGDIYSADEKSVKKDKEYRKRSLHPLQRDAIDFARSNLPDKIYGACVSCEGDLSVDKKILWGKEVYSAFIDKAHYAPENVPEKSLIRLYEPDENKRGGNGRVRSITYNDNWQSFSNESAGSYTWGYKYEDETTKKSFGVAATEPATLIDETALYYWETYYNKLKKYPDDMSMHVFPALLDLFPNPSIGYEKVEVSFWSNGVQSNKGKSVVKYHTYKTHPVLEAHSNLSNEQVKFSNIGSFLNTLGAKGIEVFLYSQGYTLQTNDFHGKIDEAITYDGFNNAQMKTKYEYYGLDEQVPMLDRKGNLELCNVGVEYDIHGDRRSFQNLSEFLMNGLNVSYTLPWGPLIITPIVNWNNAFQGFYTYALVKHINTFARVKSVESYYLGSKNVAKNLIYDKFTGNVISSSLTDEFNDELYTFSYPSHWYEPSLRELFMTTSPEYQGSMNLNVFSISSGDLAAHYSAGDYVSVTLNTLPNQPINARIITLNHTSVQLIDEYGNPLNVVGACTLNLIKSFRSNRLNEVMQDVTTKKSISTTPTTPPTLFNFPTVEIINSQASTYKDKNFLKCVARDYSKDPNLVEGRVGAIINPFNYGIAGKPVSDQGYAWQSNRINNTHEHGIRFDGTYTDYIPFYAINYTDKFWYKINESNHPNYAAGDLFKKWRSMGEISLFNWDGAVLEVESDLNISSSILYGYNKQLEFVPVAQAVNAKKQEIGFDGFEDYSFMPVSTPVLVSAQNYHFTFSNTLGSNVMLSNTIRHSGLNSLKVNSGSASLFATIQNDCITQPVGIQNGQFIVDSCKCIPPFQPIPGKDYIVGGWIYKGNSNGIIQVVITNGTTTLTTDILPTGKVIDGWMRMEGVVSIPAGYKNITVSLVNSGSGAVYFDDIRIHPFQAGMTTVVYDPNTMLPLATHDGYNFTTFYNYDENLQLVRVRVETEDGIKTITETNSGGKIQYLGN